MTSQNINNQGEEYRFQNRLKFDEKEYQYTLKESTTPLGYYINNLPYYTNNNCSQLGPGVFIKLTNNVPQNSNLVNIENELRGLNRKNSRVPDEKYNTNNQPSNLCSDKGTLDGNCYPLKPLELTTCGLNLYNFAPKKMETGLPPLEQ